MKPMTKEGYDKQRERLAEMKKEFEELPAIIAEAREKGDLKENAEYHAARERQGILQAHIAKLEGDLSGVQIVDPSALSPDLVTFGKTVKLEDLNTGEELEYTILGELEADMEKNEIGITTPVAKGLLGKELGATAAIVVPAGKRELKIKEIFVK